MEIPTAWQENFSELKECFPWILSIEEREYVAIDWEEQWQFHRGNYHEGQESRGVRKFS